MNDLSEILTGIVVGIVGIIILIGVMALIHNYSPENKARECLQGNCKQVCDSLDRNDDTEYDLWLKHCKD